MYCPYCNNLIDDESSHCTYCGNPVPTAPPPEPVPAPQPAPKPKSPSEPKDRSNFWLGVVCFFVPLAGLILYLVHFKDKPKKAKSAGIGALAGHLSKYVLAAALWVAYIFIYIIFIVIFILAGGMSTDFAEVQVHSNGVYYTSDVDVTFGDFEVISNGYSSESYLEVDVTNTSDVRRSYYITIEAVDDEGTRVAIEELYIESLDAGQSVHAYAFTEAPSYQHFDLKRATFKVIDVRQYSD